MLIRLPLKQGGFYSGANSNKIFVYKLICLAPVEILLKDPSEEPI